MSKKTNTSDLVDVELLHYKFWFKKLTWREEMVIHVDKDHDPLRTVLSNALVEVSGIKPESLEDSNRVIAAIPEAIATRVWKVYRGSLSPAKRFSTVDSYQAPQPSTYMHQAIEDVEEEDTAHDRAVKSMEARFGKEEVAAEAELSRQILESARKEKRVIPKATEDRPRG